MFDDDPSELTLLDKAERMQNGLISHATGGTFDGYDQTYRRLRRELLDNPLSKSKVPDCVKKYRDLDQFWQFIKYEYSTYKERREFLWSSFAPLIDHLESSETSPGHQPIAEALENFNSETIHSLWQKALDRRSNDPEGAITAARTLLESTCKHVLDDAGINYSHKDDLPKLWSICSEKLNLAPQQHQEKVFKTILGNCQSVVSNIAAIRNSLSDAHGMGRKPVKPKPRHAELTINLAGAMASFLIATWEDGRNNE